MEIEPKENRTFEESVAAELRAIRGRRSQDHVAPQWGVVQGTISSYERGVIPKSWRFLAMLAEREGISLNELLRSA